MSSATSDLLAKMRDGNEAYVAAGGTPTTPETDAQTIAGTSVVAAVLTCSDIKAFPEQVLGLDPGELYVLQTAGCVSGQAEVEGAAYFGPETETGLVVVLGHAPCGVLDHCLEEGSGSMGRISEELHRSRDEARQSEPEATNERIAELHTMRVARSLGAGLAGSSLRVEAAFLDEETGTVRFLHTH